LLSSLPLELREQLPDTKAVRPRLGALAARNRRRRHDQPTTRRCTEIWDDSSLVIGTLRLCNHKDCCVAGKKS
jgi:hypothetical protein